MTSGGGCENGSRVSNSHRVWDETGSLAGDNGAAGVKWSVGGGSHRGMRGAPGIQWHWIRGTWESNSAQTMRLRSTGAYQANPDDC